MTFPCELVSTLQASQQSLIMTCSAPGLSSRTNLSSSLPLLPFYTHPRPGFSGGSLSSRDSSLCGRRKGFYSEFELSPASRGFQLSSPSPSGCKRSTFLLTYLLLGGCHQKKLYFRPQSCPDVHCGAQPSSVRNFGNKGLFGRGLKRKDGHSNWKDQNSFGNVSSKAPPFVVRKKLRCWNEEGLAPELSPSDKAALESLEQAIQWQAKEETRLFFCGPARGDLAEVEAFCRLYRHAEQLHSTVMKALCTHTTDANLDNKTLGPYHGDVLQVEEKVASGLAHLMAILHEGRSGVLGMRRMGKGHPGEESSPDDLPPFARLRKEVRACCTTLEDALDSLLPADSDQGLAAQARMLKLKNVCLDAGFPRSEGIPSPADIPNLAPVRLRPSKSAKTLYKDEDVAFWRGGHITRAGLAWLVEKNFKTIVDFREGSAQLIAQCAVPEAVASGKLKVVRIPVERGNVPSKEQVEEFARLVADAGNKPLYLHTKAGVGRASAMVSRWREFVLRGQLQLGILKRESAQGTATSEIELPSIDEVVKISQEDALALEMSIRRSDNGHTSTTLKSVREESSSEDAGVGLKEASTSGHEILSPVAVDIANSDRLVQASANGSAQRHDRGFEVIKNAFEAQRPVRNILSRKAMSKFMKRRKVPAIFLTSRINRPNGNFSSTSNIAGSLVNANIGGPANRWGLANPSTTRGDASEASKQQTRTAEGASSPGNGSYATAAPSPGNSNAKLEVVNGNASRSEEGTEKSKQQNEEVGRTLGNPTREGNAVSPSLPGERSTEEEVDESTGVQGDMCASTTGVVRVQSRKKAEMYLVRTDGYSCTRERVKESTLAFSHPSTQQQMLMWKTKPRTVLLLKKLGSELTKETQEVASFLHHQEGMNVMVEPEVHDGLAKLPGFGYIQTFYSQDTSALHERVDFVVCLGGDGVILHASNIFRNAVPPVVSFNLGSLGFLTSHTFSGHQQDLQEIIHGQNDKMTGVYITLRMRLRCELYRNGRAIPGKVFDVLNEVVVDRGSSPYLSKIECYERNRLITKVQADGVIVATPTGSTAYSIAAGGSMVHPNVPCMLFTPICPHSLSFRPVILPDSAILELKVPRDARNNAWVSFDGKRRQQLSKGDSVRISMSEHPLPTVNKSDQTDDWFQSLVRCLSWNERLEQRPLSTN